MSDISLEQCWQCGAALTKTTGGNFCPLHGKVEPPVYLSIGNTTAPKKYFYEQAGSLDIQSIAERVCEVLAREVRAEISKLSSCGPVMDGMETGEEIITRPRDWPASIRQLLEIKK